MKRTLTVSIPKQALISAIDRTLERWPPHVRWYARNDPDFATCFTSAIT